MPILKQDLPAQIETKLRFSSKTEKEIYCTISYLVNLQTLNNNEEYKVKFTFLKRGVFNITPSKPERLHQEVFLPVF